MRWARLIVGVLVVCFLACLARIMYLDAQFATQLPRVPDARTGRLDMMIVQHGVRVFASKRELHTFQKAEVETVVSGLIAVSAGAWYVSRLRRRAEGGT